MILVESKHGQGFCVLQQIAIKRVYVQNVKTLPRLDLVTNPCGGFDRKSL
jgi:hypothetical protein